MTVPETDPLVAACAQLEVVGQATTFQDSKAGYKL